MAKLSLPISPYNFAIEYKLSPMIDLLLISQKFDSHKKSISIKTESI